MDDDRAKKLAELIDEGKAKNIAKEQSEKETADMKEKLTKNLAEINELNGLLEKLKHAATDIGSESVNKILNGYAYNG